MKTTPEDRKPSLISVAPKHNRISWTLLKRGLVMKTAKMIAVTVCVVGLATSAANAALITPIGATASSQLSASFDAGNLIDDSGLSGSAPHVITDAHTGTTGLTWVSSGAALPQTVTFDLGTSYSLSALHIWQYSNGSSNWSEDITVQFSTTGTGGTFGGDVAIQLADGSLSEIAQNFNLSSPVTANAVKFTITSRSGGGALHVGLSEVKFSVNTVPEPSTFALSALGLAGLGLFRRRRAKS